MSELEKELQRRACDSLSQCQDQEPSLHGLPSEDALRDEPMYASLHRSLEGSSLKERREEKNVLGGKSELVNVTQNRWQECGWTRNGDRK